MSAVTAKAALTRVKEKTGESAKTFSTSDGEERSRGAKSVTSDKDRSLNEDLNQ